MIKISLDEAYIFDYLSILEVKYSINKKKSIYANILRVSNEIIDQIGFELFDKILKSEEYRNLKDKNKFVFDLVEKAEKSDGLANEVALANIDRWNFKNKLQEKFFKSQTEEVKFGSK